MPGPLRLFQLLRQDLHQLRRRQGSGQRCALSGPVGGVVGIAMLGCRLVQGFACVLGDGVVGQLSVIGQAQRMQAFENAACRAP